MTDETQVTQQSAEQPTQTPAVLFAVYRSFNPSYSATVDGSGSGDGSGTTDYGALVGIASTKATAAQMILKDAYDHSGASSVYTAVVSALKDYPNGVDSVSFTLSSSWSVVPITVDQPLTSPVADPIPAQQS